MDRLPRHAIITATLLTAMTVWTAAPADDDRAKTLPVGPPDVVFVPEGYQVSSTWRGKTDAGVPYPGSEITWLYDPDDPTRTALIGSSYDRGSPGKGEDMTGKFPTFQAATDATVTLEEDGDRLVLISEPPKPGYRLSINRQIIDVWAEDGNVIALWLQRNETPPPDGIAETLIAKSASELDTLDTVD